MTNKPVYEIVKVLKDKIFIVGLGDPPITDNLELVYEECNKQFPNKRIIFYNDVADRIAQLKYSSSGWSEMLESEHQDETKQPGNLLRYEITYELTFKQYNEKIPKIKGWDIILHNIQ